MFRIMRGFPRYDGRDAITGTDYVQAHPCTFETLALAHKLAGRLSEAEPPYSDDHFEVWGPDNRPHFIPPPEAANRVPLTDDEIPF